MAHRGARAAVTLHRFFLPPEALRDGRVAFPPDIARQMERVLRLKAGERVVVLDGTGREYVVLLSSVGRPTTGAVEESRDNCAEPATKLTLFQGLLKGTKFDLVLQKGTELGVSRFIPVTTARSIPSEPRASRHGRYSTIVREAAEQSRRGRIPKVRPAEALAESLAASAGELTIFLWEEGGALHLCDISLPHRGGSVNLFVGPEGGFSSEEAKLARGFGAHIVTLGPRILRAETAAIAGAALVLAGCGEL